MVMTIAAMQASLASVDDVLNFIAQCPASKRGRPMSVGNAMRMEKAAPGSVCAKESRARDGKGLRQVFYKMKAGAKVPSSQRTSGESEYDKSSESKQSKEKAPPEAPGRISPAPVQGTTAAKAPKPVNKPQNTGNVEAKVPQPARLKKDSKQSLVDYPTFKSNIEGASESQTVWGKAFHHSIERQLRSYLGGLSGQKPELSPYAQEAWSNLTKIDKAGTAFGLKGLNGEGLFWALLSPESAKIAAQKTKKNLADSRLGPVFLRVMKGKFKDDAAYQDAVSHAQIWPIPIWPTSTSVSETQPAAVVKGPAAKTPVAKAPLAATTVKPQGKLARLAGKVKGSKLAGKAKVAFDKAKSKAVAAKQKADEWSKNHPVLSWIAKTGAKAGLGALTGLMQQQAATKNMTQRLDEVDQILKAYSQRG